MGLMLILFLSFSCSDNIVSECEEVSSTLPPDSSYTFTQIQEQIFNNSCAISNCHTGSIPQANLNLSAGQSYSSLVNVPSQQMPSLQRVEPGNSADSYIIKKLEGNGISGERMPFNQSPLPDNLINKIKVWIDDGAPNN
jgi:hypothetical protein